MPMIAMRDPIPADWTDWHRMWSEACGSNPLHAGPA
jgi:hypothetical protein